MRIVAVRPHQGRVLLTFEGTSDVSTAETLRGAELSVSAADVAPRPEGFVYHWEIEGAAVVDAAGRPLGRVAELRGRGRAAAPRRRDGARPARRAVRPSDRRLRGRRGAEAHRPRPAARPPRLRPAAMRFDVVTLFPGYFASPFDESLVGRAVRRGPPRPAGRRPARLQRRRPPKGGRRALRRGTRNGPHRAAASSRPWKRSAPRRTRRRRTSSSCLRRAAGSTRRSRRSSRRVRASPSCAGATRESTRRTREAGLFDEEISLGDFVLSGGEVAALAIVEAVSRYVPGVVGDAGSVHADSFEDGLLDHPHYSRPREFRGPRRAGGPLLGPPREDPALAAREAARGDAPAGGPICSRRRPSPRRKGRTLSDLRPGRDPRRILRHG